jgi:hypothetical protein
MSKSSVKKQRSGPGNLAKFKVQAGHQMHIARITFWKSLDCQGGELWH